MTTDPDFGTDLALGPGGFASSMPTVSGRSNLLLALYRRCTTDPNSTAGKQIYGGKCADIRLWLASPLATGAGSTLGQMLVKAVRADERVSDATATVTIDAPNKRLAASLTITPSQGPAFSFVLSFDSVTVEILDGTA